MYSEITSGRVLNGELLYTKILEVNLFAFAFANKLTFRIFVYIYIYIEREREREKFCIQVPTLYPGSNINQGL